MDQASFPVVNVDSWAVAGFEAVGSDEKVWLVDPQGERRALFKPNERQENSQQGEDWPEKVASELAVMLGLPAARVDLAIRRGRRGCISHDVVPSGGELQHGTVLLEGYLGFHDPMDREHRGHTLTNVRKVLEPYMPPPDFTGPADFDAFDAFAGYLMFDALIVNRDRHPENWAVLRGPHSARLHLAPSYDHASGLGFNLLDRRREQLLRDARMREAFIRKGTAHRFEGCQQVTLSEFALRALEMAGADVRRYWLGRLATVRHAEFEEVIGRVPGMSEPARTFALWLLDTSKGRLIHG